MRFLKRLIPVLLCTASLSCAFAEAPYVIVASDHEKNAAAELKTYLDKITGESFTITDEKTFDKKKNAIYLGNTEFAEKHGIDSRKLDLEEWQIKSEGGNLIIAGGRINGTLYGVYDFLENQLGCHWFTMESETVPQKKDLSFAGLDIRKQPSFAERTVYIPQWGLGLNKEYAQRLSSFLKKNGSNMYSGPLRASPSLPNCHNLYSYVPPEKYFKEHPEYYSMDEKGKRFHGAKQSGAQLCMSNPEVWKITLESLREFIKKDRASLPQEKWPGLYVISQLDDTNFTCKCPECLKITEKEGSEAGLLLTYINYAAKNIAREYPEIRILTEAYVHTEKAPLNIRPEPNVIIRWCDLYTKSDCYRPLTGKFNEARKEQLEGWKKLGANLAVWDYWNMGIEGQYFDPPRVEVMLDAIAPDLRYFKETGVTMLFMEAEYCIDNPQNFIDLQYWLGLQLALDTEKDPEKLIELYMSSHYGPAAKTMTEFLNYLRNAVRNEQKPLFYIFNPVREYCNAGFLKKSYDYLRKAQEETPENTPYRTRVNKEMITPLCVMLLNPQMKTGLDKNKLLEEYKKYRLEQINAYCSPDTQQEFKKRLENQITKLTLEIPTPSQFAGIPPENIKKFAWPHVRSGSVQDDPESVIGKALVTTADKTKHDMSKPGAGSLYPTWFGLYDAQTKRSSAQLKLNAIPQDEKYHWYKIDSFDFGKDTFLWGFFWLNSLNLSSVYTNADGLPGFNTWDVWVSVKVTGPVYVKDSQKENCIYLDQVILIKPNISANK